MFMKKRREGFTLVELLIVMAVIAALMGALVPVAISAINHANATRIAENLQSLVTQVQQYAYSEHKIPTIGDLSGSVSGGNLDDYTILGTTTTNSTQIKFAVVYNKSISASDVNNVWKGAQAVGTINNWLDSKSATGSVGATGIISVYW